MTRRVRKPQSGKDDILAVILQENASGELRWPKLQFIKPQRPPSVTNPDGRIVKPLQVVIYIFVESSENS